MHKGSLHAPFPPSAKSYGLLRTVGRLGPGPRIGKSTQIRSAAQCKVDTVLRWSYATSKRKRCGRMRQNNPGEGCA